MWARSIHLAFCSKQARTKHVFVTFHILAICIDVRSRVINTRNSRTSISAKKILNIRPSEMNSVKNQSSFKSGNFREEKLHLLTCDGTNAFENSHKFDGRKTLWKCQFCLPQLYGFFSDAVLCANILFRFIIEIFSTVVKIMGQKN